MELKFEYNKWRIFKEAWSVYFCFTLHFAINIYFAWTFGKELIDFPINWLYGLIVNIPFFIINIPNFIIHRNYLKYTKNHILKVTDEKLILETKDSQTTIEFNSIEKINVNETTKHSKIPWNNYAWYEVIDKNNNIIKICTYLAPIDNLWEEFMSKKIDKKIITYFPPLEDRDKWFPLWDFSFPLIK